jgi:hypothetical protein
MTMETYRWQREHVTSPPLTISIMRSLPNGDWRVQSEEVTLPPEFPQNYETLEKAKAAADDAARTERKHDCKTAGCGAWMPVPPNA